MKELIKQILKMTNNSKRIWLIAGLVLFYTATIAQTFNGRDVGIGDYRAIESDQAVIFKCADVAPYGELEIITEGEIELEDLLVANNGILNIVSGMEIDMLSTNEFELQGDVDIRSDMGFFDRTCANPNLQAPPGVDLSDEEKTGETGNHFAIYPNPFFDIVNIRFTAAGTASVTLQVFDTAGRLVDERSYPATGNGELQEIQYNGYQLSDGLYIYKLQTGNVIESGLISKQ